MNQPWGLSGPQFLGIYGAGMAAFVAVPWLSCCLPGPSARHLLGFLPPSWTRTRSGTWREERSALPW